MCIKIYKCIYTIMKIYKYIEMYVENIYVKTYKYIKNRKYKNMYNV